MNKPCRNPLTLLLVLSSLLSMPLETSAQTRPEWNITKMTE